MDPYLLLWAIFKKIIMKWRINARSDSRQLSNFVHTGQNNLTAAPIIKLGVRLGWRLQEVIGQPRLLKRSGQISPYRWEWHSKWGRNWDVRPATCYVRQCWITQLSKVRGFSEVGDCVRPDACAPTVACRFIFFGRQKNSIPWRRAWYKIHDERNSRRYAVFFVLIFLLLDGMLIWLLARTAGKNHRAVRAPFKKKTKNEVKRTKNLKILLSGICCGAGFSQCTFGHSQIRLQTSGHEWLLARIPENWITFGKSLEIESQKNSFC